jgi:two-component system alkaline phosphatase synthesis response regulator PhoP
MLKKTILLIDENSSLVELIKIIFHDYHFHVFPEGSFQEISQQLDTFKSNLVLIDSHITGYKALNTIELLKKHDYFQSVPIIMMGTNPNIDKIAMAAGADDYISKPFDLTDLEGKVFHYTRYQMIESNMNYCIQ